MSFSKIDKEDHETPEGRECVLVYGYRGKNYTTLKHYCIMMGIRDVVDISPDMLGEKVENILDNKVTKTQCLDAPKDQVIILSAFSGKRLHTFLGNFNKTGLVRPLMATVTPSSLKWTVLELIYQLQEERQAIKNNKQASHEQ